MDKIKLDNGECTACGKFFNQSDCFEVIGCGCQMCYDGFKDGDCPECGSEADIAEKAHEKMLSVFTVDHIHLRREGVN